MGWMQSMWMDGEWDGNVPLYGMRRVSWLKRRRNTVETWNEPDSTKAHKRFRDWLSVFPPFLRDGPSLCVSAFLRFFASRRMITYIRTHARPRLLNPHPPLARACLFLLQHPPYTDTIEASSPRILRAQKQRTMEWVLRILLCNNWTT